AAAVLRNTSALYVNVSLLSPLAPCKVTVGSVALVLLMVTAFVDRVSVGGMSMKLSVTICVADPLLLVALRLNSSTPLKFGAALFTTRTRLLTASMATLTFGTVGVCVVKRAGLA